MSKPDYPIFVVRRGDRLAARIKNVLYAWRFARRVGGQAIVSWLPRERTFYNALASESYHPALIWNLAKFYPEGGARELLFMEGPYRGDQTRRSLAGPDFAANRPNSFRIEQFAGRAEVFEDTDHLVYQFEGETRDEVTAEVRALFDRLPLTTEVSDILTTAQRALGDEYVCLHLRRGDIPAVLRAAKAELRSGVVTDVVKVYATHAALRTAPFAFYYGAVEAALARGKRIVFFSDSPDTFQHFSDKYGAASFVNGTRFASRARADLQKAFIDFKLLAGAHEIIGTSTGYSSIAALLGGNSLTTVTAAGSLDTFNTYLFDELFEGEDLSSEVRDEIISAFSSRYAIYQDKYRRLEARRLVQRSQSASVA